jgi:dCMP deaminase
MKSKIAAKKINPKEIKVEERTHVRPSWDDYFMAMVKIVATRGTCDRLYAGSVLVKENRIIATGYNGSPAGLPHCSDVGHLLEEGHCVRTIHGEHNALLQAARQGSTSTNGSTMYTKYSPCVHCTKYIISCGVKRVVVGKTYRNSQAIDMLKEAGVEVEIYQEKPEWRGEILKIFEEDIPERRNEGAVKMKASK